MIHFQATIEILPEQSPVSIFSKETKRDVTDKKRDVTESCETRLYKRTREPKI